MISTEATVWLVLGLIGAGSSISSLADVYRTCGARKTLKGLLINLCFFAPFVAALFSDLYRVDADEPKTACVVIGPIDSVSQPTSQCTRRSQIIEGFIR